MTVKASGWLALCCILGFAGCGQSDGSEGSAQAGSAVDASTSTTGLVLAEGEVELTILTKWGDDIAIVAQDDDPGPTDIHSLGNTQLAIVAAAHVELWWETVLPDASLRAETVAGVMLKKDDWEAGFASAKDLFNVSPARFVVTDEAGRAVIGVDPGAYLLCQMYTPGAPGFEESAGVSSCGNVRVADGDTTWTFTSREGEAGDTTMEWVLTSK